MSRYLRYAVRRVLRRPGLFLVQAVSLAAGVAFATTIFILGDALFLAPLPVSEPEQLFSVLGRQEKQSNLLPISFPNFEDLRRHDGAFSDLAAYQWNRATLRELERPERFSGEIVTPNYFRVLGVELAHGRTFSAHEENAAVVSQDLARRLGATPATVLGRSITLDNNRYTVIGVVPSDFRGIGAMGFVADYYLPMSMFERISTFGKYKDERGALLFAAIGRLRQGVAPAVASEDLKSMAQQLRRAFPKENASLELVARPLGESLIDPSVRPDALLGAWIAAGFSVLLILVVGLNVWTLQWVRASEESSGVATRLALGASGSELFRQLVAEAILLIGVTAVAAVLIAGALGRWVWSLRPPSFAEDFLAVGLNWRVVLFGLVVSTLVTFIASSVALMRSSRGDLSSLMKAGGGRGAGAQRLSMRLRYVVLAMQVAMALLATAMAGMFVRSLQNALTVDAGFDRERVLLAEYDLKGEGLSTEQARQLDARFMQAAAALPGVESVALATFPPLAPWTPQWRFTAEGDETEPRPLVHFNPVEGDYFRTSGLSILQGREFSGEARAGTLPVAVINRTMAERYWPGNGALGDRLLLGPDQTEYTVVGVVQDSKYQSLDEDPLPYVYVSREQVPQTRGTLFLRSRGDPGYLTDSVRDTLQTLAPRVPITRVETLESILSGSLWSTRLAVLASTTVGAVCWVLALFGVFGVVAAVARTRRREIAIRLALGAGPRQCLAHVYRPTFLSFMGGCVAGAVAAIVANRFVGSILFGVSVLDLPAIVGTAVLLALICGLGTLVPARRALQAPVPTVLRED